MNDTEWIPDDEEIVWEEQPHPASQAGTIVTGVITLLFGIGIPILIGAYINLKYTHYAVTDRAVYLRKGFMSDKVNRVPLGRIQNIEWHRSFLENQFGFGTIDISTAGSSNVELSFRAIPNPDGIQSDITKLTRQLDERDEEEETDAQTLDSEELAKELKETRESLENVLEFIKQR